MKPSPNAVDQDDLITSDVATDEDKDGPPLLHCERCGYDWHPQGDIPRQCALCRSAYWTKPLSIRNPEIRAEHQAKARERANRRRVREAHAARIKRLKKIATKLGPESRNIVQAMFADTHVVSPIAKAIRLGMPPPPKFED